MRQLRQAKGLTCTEVGFRVRMTCAAISNIELGQRPPPDVKRIAQLGTALEASPEEVRRLALLAGTERATRVKSGDTIELARVVQWLAHRGHTDLARAVESGLWLLELQGQIAASEAQIEADFGGAELELDDQGDASIEVEKQEGADGDQPPAPGPDPDRYPEDRYGPGALIRDLTGCDV